MVELISNNQLIDQPFLQTLVNAVNSNNKTLVESSFYLYDRANLTQNVVSLGKFAIETLYYPTISHNVETKVSSTPQKVDFKTDFIAAPIVVATLQAADSSTAWLANNLLSSVVTQSVTNKGCTVKILTGAYTSQSSTNFSLSVIAIGLVSGS